MNGEFHITGANEGLGSALAYRIASSTDFNSYHGVYTVRDPDNVLLYSNLL